MLIMSRDSHDLVPRILFSAWSRHRAAHVRPYLVVHVGPYTDNKPARADGAPGERSTPLRDRAPRRIAAEFACPSSGLPLGPI